MLQGSNLSIYYENLIRIKGIYLAANEMNL